MPRRHLVERVEVHRRVLADRGVRATAGLHADDAVRRQRFALDEELHVLAREDVVGDHAQPIAFAQRLAERVDQRSFPRSDRASDADAQWGDPLHRFHITTTTVSGHDLRIALHDRNNLECRYCCDIAAMSIAGVNDSGSASRSAIAPTTDGTRASVRARSACAAV